MKKKIKLFTTLASLGLAIALMAFGVYASIHQDLGVTSKVSFTATSVFVDIAAQVVDSDFEHSQNYSGFTHDLTNPGKQPNPWSIEEDLVFTEDLNTIEYEFIIANYTDATIYVTFVGLAESYDYGGTAYVTSTVETDDGGTLTGREVSIVKATDSATPTTAIITVTLTLGSFNTSFAAASSPVDFTVQIDRTTGAQTRT